MALPEDDDNELDTPVIQNLDQSQMTGSNSPTALPQSGVNPAIQSYLNQLKQAQNQVKQNQFITGLTAAGQQLAHGISRAPGSADVSATLNAGKADTAPVENLQAQESGKVNALKTEQAMSSTDPDSEQSKAFRKSLLLVAPKIAQVYGDNFDKITASDAPQIMKTVDLSAQISQRAQAAKDRMDILGVSKAAQIQSHQDAQDSKQSMRDEQDLAKAGKAFNSLTASSRSALGTASKAKISAQRLSDIVDNPNSTNQDLQSAYADLNNIVSGSTSISGTEHQSYNTLSNQLAGALQYITSNPQAPNIPEIKAHVKDVANRMSQISDQVIDKNTRTVSASYPGLAKRMPEAWANLVKESSGGDSGASGLASGIVLIKDPQGNIRRIPAPEKEAALKAGGVLVQ